MLTKLSIKLKSDKDLPSQLGCIFHSIFLESISNESANGFHSGSHDYRPYRSVIKKIDHNIYEWEIIGLTSAVSELITNDWKSSLVQKKYVQTFDAYLEPLENKITFITYRDIYKNNYSNHEPDPVIRVHFNTPTSFKSNGVYIQMPNEQMILRSLLMKWDDFSDEVKLFDFDLLNMVSEKVFISKIFHLKTIPFRMDKSTINGFCGEVLLNVKNANKQIIQLVNLLFDFAEYSGIGIKTAMGMGNVEVVKNINHKMYPQVTNTENSILV